MVQVCNNNNNNNNNNNSSKTWAEISFYIKRQPGWRQVRITTTPWCANGCPHIRPEPGFKHLEFGTVYITIIYLVSLGNC